MANTVESEDLDVQVIQSLPKINNKYIEINTLKRTIDLMQDLFRFKKKNSLEIL